jgi:hypothetical protein
VLSERPTWSKAAMRNKRYSVKCLRQTDTLVTQRCVDQLKSKSLLSSSSISTSLVLTVSNLDTPSNIADSRRNLYELRLRNLGTGREKILEGALPIFPFSLQIQRKPTIMRIGKGKASHQL